MIQKKLGHGAMGSVYLALDTPLDRPVALKLINSDFNDHPDMASRFLVEARVLASLTCSNIPILYNYFMWQGKGVMAMEYIDGETLEGMIRQRGPIPANISVPLVKQALQGLVAAHDAGVVHRDLKPGNIMVNKKGTVKVVDFGIAKKLESEAGLTGTNTTMGTPWYMSPEQIMGKPVTARSDIYSMGVVLYELLAGQVPFHADSIYEIHTAHVEKVPEPPTVHYPHIPPSIVAVVMKALQKDPKDRFASADEFIRALPDLPPLAVPGTGTISEVKPIADDGLISERAGSSPGQSKPAVSAGSVSFPPPQPRKSYGRIVGAAACAVLVLLGVGGWLVFNKGPKKDSGGGGGSALSASNNQPQRPVEAPLDTGSSIDIPAETPGLEPHPKPVPHTGGKSESVTPPADPAPKPVAPAPVTPPVVATGQELSGIWQGTYTDNLSASASTRVQVRIQEHDGAQVDGMLSFTKTDNTTGSCTLQGSSYNAGTRKLTLLTHCSDAPAYFNFPAIFPVPDPTERNLSGKAMSKAVIALQR